MTTKFTLHSAISIVALLGLSSTEASASISFVPSSPTSGVEAGYYAPQGSYSVFNIN